MAAALQLQCACQIQLYRTTESVLSGRGRHKRYVGRMCGRATRQQVLAQLFKVTVHARLRGCYFPLTSSELAPPNLYRTFTMRRDCSMRPPPIFARIFAAAGAGHRSPLDRARAAACTPACTENVFRAIIPLCAPRRAFRAVTDPL